MDFAKLNLVGDYLQFVNYTEIMATHTSPACKEAAFAKAALMEIPKQYTAIKYLEGVRYSHVFFYFLIYKVILVGIENLFLTL